MGRIKKALIAGLVVLFASGCLPAGLRRDQLKEGSVKEGVELAEVPVLGYQVRVERMRPLGEPDYIDGELLAVDLQYLWLLEEDGCLRRVPRKLVSQVSTEPFSTHPIWLGVWTSLGAISAVSHGFIAMLTVPAWLITGGPTTVWEALRNIVTFETDEQMNRGLYQYARFPQGMPKGFTPRTINPRAVCLNHEPVTAPIQPDEPPSPEPSEVRASSAKAPQEEATPQEVPEAAAEPVPKVTAKPAHIATVPGEPLGAFLQPDGSGVLRASGESRAADPSGLHLQAARTAAANEIVRLVCRAAPEACAVDAVRRDHIRFVAERVDPETGRVLVRAELTLADSGLSAQQCERIWKLWRRQ